MLLWSSVSVDFDYPLDTAHSLQLFACYQDTEPIQQLQTFRWNRSYLPGARSKLSAFTLMSRFKPCLPLLWYSCGAQMLYPCDLRKAQVAFLLVISDIIPVPMLPSCDLCPQLLFLGEAEAPPEYTSCRWVNTASASGTEHSTARGCTAASCLWRSLCLDVQMPGVATAGLVTPSVSVVSLPLQSLCVLPSEELLAPLVCPFVHQGLLGPLATLSAWHP